MKPVVLEHEKIDSMSKRLLASSLIADLQKHFDDPENQRRFKEWQERRKTNDQHRVSEKTSLTFA